MMLIQHLQVSGLLSFGPSALSLPMGGLNVLIGPNGSGKSNFLEVLALLQAAPRRLAAPIRASGGLIDWLWKPGQGGRAVEVAELHVDLQGPETFERGSLQHHLRVESNGGRFDLAKESIKNRCHVEDAAPEDVYVLENGWAKLRGSSPVGAAIIESRWPKHELNPEESILSQHKTPFGQSSGQEVLNSLRSHYEGIRLYRDCSFGPAAKVRNQPRADERNDFLHEDFGNLALVLSQSRYLAAKRRIEEEMMRFYEGFVSYEYSVQDGRVQLFMVEEGGRQIPVGRLSDGTLRYLGLLAILLDPEPPTLIAIEEPELGLHPDVIPRLAELLLEASERTQLVVTTHSRLLVDALSGVPESIVVCSKENGETRMERLSADDLSEWLKNYSLGELWSKGEIGGNRW